MCPTLLTFSALPHQRLVSEGGLPAVGPRNPKAPAAKARGGSATRVRTPGTNRERQRATSPNPLEVGRQRDASPNRNRPAAARRESEPPSGPLPPSMHPFLVYRLTYGLGGPGKC